MAAHIIHNSDRLLQVAIAIIERGEHVLIGHRPHRAGDHIGGYWEFPGGKRHVGESWEACLRREVREELGVSIHRLRRLGRLRYRYPTHRVVFCIFRCNIAAGQPRPLSAQTLRWVARRQLRRYQFPAANAPLVAQLAGASSRRRVLK